MTRLPSKARREADAQQLANVVRAFARAHGAPVTVTATELAQRASDAVATFTPMRVGSAAERVVQILVARGWAIYYRDVLPAQSKYPMKGFIITREGR